MTIFLWTFYLKVFSTDFFCRSLNAYQRFADESPSVFTQDFYLCSKNKWVRFVMTKHVLHSVIPRIRATG